MHQNTVDWLEHLSNFRLPRWSELPDFELYADQVISFIEKYLGVLFGNEKYFITTSMVHNYVKLQLMRKPEKKRYGRNHVASLLTITILKQVLVISDIRTGIDLYVEKKENAGLAYDLFCEEIEYSIKVMLSEVLGKNVVKVVIENEIVAVRMAAYAFASKMLARYILENDNKN